MEQIYLRTYRLSAWIRYVNFTSINYFKIRVYTALYGFPGLSESCYITVVKYVSYFLPNNVVSPKSLSSSQTLVYTLLCQ